MTVVVVCGVRETIVVETAQEGLPLSVGQGNSVVTTEQVVSVEMTLPRHKPVS
jgi:hypothetical protein